MDATASTKPDWERAACWQHPDPNIFHTTEKQDPRPAKAVCVTCPIQVDCMLWALETKQQDGIWGGTTPHERRRINHGEEVVLTRACAQCGVTYIVGLYQSRFCSKSCRRAGTSVHQLSTMKTHGRHGYQCGCRCTVCVNGEHDYNHQRKTG